MTNNNNVDPINKLSERVYLRLGMLLERLYYKVHNIAVRLKRIVVLISAFEIHYSKNKFVCNVIMCNKDNCHLVNSRHKGNLLCSLNHHECMSMLLLLNTNIDIKK